MRLTVLVLIVLARHSVCRSVITIIREHDSNSDKMVTFVLSSVQMYGKNTNCPEGYGETISHRSRANLLMTKSVFAKSNQLLKKMFKKLPSPLTISHQKSVAYPWDPDYSINFVDDMNSIIAKSKDLQIDIRKYFENSEGNMWNQVIFPSSSDFMFCYDKGVIKASVIALILIDKEITDFNLSIVGKTLMISQNPIIGGQAVPLMIKPNFDRGAQINGPESITLQRMSLMVEKIMPSKDLDSARKTDPPADPQADKLIDDMIHPLINPGLPDLIKSVLKTSVLENKLLIKMKGKIIHIFERPMKEVKIMLYNDGFDVGYMIKFNSGDSGPIGSMLDIMGCVPKSITVLETPGKYFGVLCFSVHVACKPAGRIIV